MLGINFIYLFQALKLIGNVNSSRKQSKCGTQKRNAVHRTRGSYPYHNGIAITIREGHHYSTALTIVINQSQTILSYVFL